MKMKKILAACLALVLVLTIVTSSFATTYNTSYNSTNNPVRHHFYTSSVSKNQSETWYHAKDINISIKYYNIDTGVETTTGTYQDFYAVTGTGSYLSGKKTTSSGGSATASISSTTSNIKLKIYNPNYVDDGHVVFRLKTVGQLQGGAN